MAPLPFHVSCLTCDRFYVTSVGLVRHQLACFVHKQSSTIGVAMILALSIFLLYFAWAWIASKDIIDVFHLGLSPPCSYHHIPYALCVYV